MKGDTIQGRKLFAEILYKFMVEIAKNPKFSAVRSGLYVVQCTPNFALGKINHIRPSFVTICKVCVFCTRGFSYFFPSLDIGAIHKLCFLGKGVGVKSPILRRRSLWTTPYCIYFLRTIFGQETFSYITKHFPQTQLEV